MTYVLISGAIAMGCGVVSLFFLQFWKKTRDRLFGIFALSFLILGIERVIPILTEIGNERQTLQYIIRLLAFLLILLAIIDKNFKNNGSANH